jgi:hypothetical protein
MGGAIFDSDACSGQYRVPLLGIEHRVLVVLKGLIVVSSHRRGNIVWADLVDDCCQHRLCRD